MAILTERIASRLTLAFMTGEDDKGMPIVKKKAYSRIKADATDEALHQVAMALASVQTLPLHGLERIDTNSIEQA